VYFGPQAGWLVTPILARGDLATPRPGPAVIEEYDATCVVPPDARASLDAYGNIVMEL
jgi:N-methylhydantoinase A